MTGAVTPTYSSWINQVERWFGLLTEKQIRRGTHRSVRQLEDAIRLYLATYNENPRPLTWVKTADEILDSVRRFCLRTSVPGRWRKLCGTDGELRLSSALRRHGR